MINNDPIQHPRMISSLVLGLGLDLCRPSCIYQDNIQMCRHITLVIPSFGHFPQHIFEYSAMLKVLQLNRCVNARLRYEALQHLKDQCVSHELIETGCPQFMQTYSRGFKNSSPT